MEFPQTGGLGASDEVQVNGIRKGAVQSMELVGDRVYVVLALSSDVQITTDSRVAIRNVGLMGEKVIAVDLVVHRGRLCRQATRFAGIFESGMQEVMAGLGDAMSARVARPEQAAQRRLPRRWQAHGDVARARCQNIKGTSDELRRTVEENRHAAELDARQPGAVDGYAMRRVTVDREENRSPRPWISFTVGAREAWIRLSRAARLAEHVALELGVA